MFENIQKTIKSLAKLIFWLSFLIGIIWGIYIIYYYSNLNHNYYVLKSRLSLLPPVMLFFGGAVSSFLIYGFGEIIEILKNIDNKLNGNIETNDNNYESTASATE